MSAPKGTRMRFPIRISTRIVLAAVVTTAGLATGCRKTVIYDEPSYRQWESDTQREHREFKQRTDDEKRQYNDWHRDHQRH